MVIEGVVKGWDQVAQVCNVTIGCVALENWVFGSWCWKKGQLREVNKNLFLWFTMEDLQYGQSAAPDRDRSDCLKERFGKLYLKAAL